MKILRFTGPQKSEVVILHHNYFWIKKYILKNLSATVLAEKPKIFFITFPLFIQTVFNLHLIDWKDVIKNLSHKYLIQKLYQIYILACIKKTNAKVVITFIDNSTFAQQLSRIDNERSYFFVQNGTRTLGCVRDILPLPPHPQSVISMTNFFCFGDRDINLFSSHGHQVDNFFPVGSLITGCYKNIFASKRRKKFDICLISQWDKNYLGNTEQETSLAYDSRIGAGIKKLNFFLKKFINETNITLVVCLRHDNHQDEIDFYKRLFGNKIVIAKSNYYNFSSYLIADQSRLLIALNSTLLAEAFSWGNKVLWCNVTNDELFKMDEAGLSYFCENNYDAFKKRVNKILRMPAHRYKNMMKEKAKYICNFDVDRPPHKVIRSAILEKLA